MYVLIIIYIVVALLIGLFSVFVVGREIVIEEKNKRQKRKTVDAKTQVAKTAASAEPETQAVELSENKKVQRRP